ncbi:hypothetical protein [Novosphingobium lentum]|uniref:hypothetical protein n=1 Tax=Novosphingobium lentum TaxID=145287 RepID=UPI0008311B91|nr:hypothetical protein [Novosphingobium lentum]
MTDKRTRRVRDRIEAAHERNEAAAAAQQPPKSRVRQLAEDHPIAMLAGGIVVGALVARFVPVGRLLPAGLGRKVRRNALSLATVATELAAAYGAGAGEFAAVAGAKAADFASEAGREGRERIEDLGEVVSEAGTEARRRAADFAEVAVNGARGAGVAAMRRVGEIASRVRH